MRGLGFLHEDGMGPQLAWNITSVQPVLSYSPNINGGLPGDRFQIGKFEFEVDPDSRALSGPVFGAAISQSTGWSIGTGQTVSVGGSVQVVYSPEYELSRTNASFQACLRSYAENWQFLDLCGGTVYAEEDLGETNGNYISASYSKLFSTASGTNLANVALTQEFQKDYDKTSIAVGLERYFSGRGVLTLRAAAGQEVEGENTLLYGMYASYGQLVLGVGTNIGLSYEREGGDVLFGMDRDDEIFTLSVTGQISKSVSATVSFEKRQSSIDLFEGNEVTLNLNVLNLQF
jgi:hypothetical protein